MKLRSFIGAGDGGGLLGGLISGRGGLRRPAHGAALSTEDPLVRADVHTLELDS